jgi:hypothetical protein
LSRYIFKYTPEPTRGGTIYRPKARVQLQSKDKEWYSFWVYIDSGADLSLFTRSDAALLSLNLREGEYRPIMGIGGVLIPAYIHCVNLKIEGTVLSVKTAFADSDEVPRLLGRTDVFNHFRITFDEGKLETILETLST